MPLINNYVGASAWIVTENEDQFLMVMVDGKEGGAWRFQIGVPTLARLNAECAARLVTKVQRAAAYIKTDEASVMILGPK